MTIFSFSKATSFTAAILSAFVINSTPTQANDFGILDTQVVMGKQSCLRGYDKLPAIELWKGGCYDEHSLFEECRASINAWTSLQSNTDRNCLKIWGSIALNSRGKDFQFYTKSTFREVQAQYAYHLSRNELYMETLAGLDQAEMKKIASRVSKAWE